MSKLSKKLLCLRPFKRSVKTRPEEGEGSEVAAGSSRESAFVQIQTNREKHGLFDLVSVASEEDFSVDIVAVHGLSGDWESTWTDPESKSLWLRDFIPLQFPDLKLRIWSFGYDSSTAFTNSVADIDDAAKALINALDGERQRKSSRRRPIIFIAHSLGGIIVKRAMNLANERSELWKDIVESVFSIVFFAVPHRGAGAAYLATVAAQVYKFATLNFGGNKNFVEALKRNSPEFWQISEAFIQPASNLAIIRSFYETTKIANNIIVDKYSASLELNNERAIPIQGANHRDICKFFSDGSQKYKPVRNALRDIIEAALHKEDRNSEEDAFLDSLRFPHMFEGLGDIHNSEHYRWLYRDKTFQDWFRNQGNPRKPRLLWVTGAPGSGKSTAIRGAYHQLLEEQDVLHGSHRVAAFCFQKDSGPLLRCPDGLYRALLYQILSHRRKTISEVIRKRHPKLRGDEAADSYRQDAYDYRELLLGVLSEDRHRSQSTTILIDALDECVDQSDLNLDRFFHDIVKSDDFSALNICLSSRHFGAARWLWLRPLSAIEENGALVEIDAPVIEVETENRGAIRDYIEEKLRVYSRDTSELVALKEQILTRSLGIFLWVEAIVDRLIEDLRRNKPGQLELRLRPTPSRLQNLYDGILCTAEDRAKSWRFFQWLFLAPDLSLQAWRDLIPFLQDNAPRSLKNSRNSEDWASGLSTSVQGHPWIPDLQRIICRISLGLVQVALVSDSNVKMPADDCHSIGGEAGSWNTADGDNRIVRPVHESLRQCLLYEGGFNKLHPRVDDHYEAGLIMAMNTCLDFIEAREFTRLSKASLASKDIEPEASTVSLLSDGDGSARTSISRHSSARSLVHKPVYNGIISYSMESSMTHSMEDLELYDGALQQGAMLARLNREAKQGSDSLQEKQLRVERWRDSVAEACHFNVIPSPTIASSFQHSTRSLRWENWSSELLSYLLTVFPEFARSAERAGTNSSHIVIRLRRGGLWAHWRHLSEEMPINTSLKQWAESQELHTWVNFLTRTKESATLPGSGETRRPGLSRWINGDMNLSYCSDGGEGFLQQSACSHLPEQARHISSAPISYSLREQLSVQIHSAMVKNTHGKEFISYLRLKSVLTETAVADLLAQEMGLAPEKARQVRACCLRVLGILIITENLPCMELLFKRGLNDKFLPVKLIWPGPRQNSVLTSQVSGKDISIPEGIEGITAFELYQWSFLSPFLAKPSGQLQHYKLWSHKQPLPIIERPSAMRFQQHIEEKVRFSPDSFDFGEHGFQKEARELSGWFLMKSFKGVTWKRFLSIVYAYKLVSHREQNETGVLPLLCTLEHPNPGDSSKSDYYLILPLPRESLGDLTQVDPTRQNWLEQLTEQWLVSQCSRMAASLSQIHQVAALKISHLPRLLFLRSGGLAPNVIFRLSSSESQLGILVFDGLCSEPPGSFESPPEYFIALEKSSQSSLWSLWPQGLRESIGASNSEILEWGARKLEIKLMQYSHDLIEASPLPGSESWASNSLPQLRKRVSSVDTTSTDQKTAECPWEPIDEESRERPPEKLSASKFHVWCLATVWLQLITWFCLGPEGIKFLKEAAEDVQSQGQFENSGFFERMPVTSKGKSRPDESYRIRPIITESIERLQTHKRCTASIRQLLAIIRDRMLVIDIVARASSQEVMEKLEEIERNLREQEKRVEKGPVL